MTFLYSPRSLKRNRLLKKASVICLIISLGILFYLAKNGPDFKVREFASSSTSSSVHHERYHLYDQELYYKQQKKPLSFEDAHTDIDVTVPRHALLDSLRKARASRLSRGSKQEESIDNADSATNQGQLFTEADRSSQQQNVQEQKELQKIPTLMTDHPANILEDKVYKSSQDDLYLPAGNGKDPNEKYLGFYPHSGFHNQRIALVNALMLAERLNRTLLVPPVMLGSPIHWRKHDSLDSYHRRLSKANLDHCRIYLQEKNQKYTQQQQQRQEEQEQQEQQLPFSNTGNTTMTAKVPHECQQSFKYTSLRWDRLFDMDQIKQRVRVRYRDDYERSYLERNYGISRSDIYYVKDELLYDYRIVEAARLNNKNPVTVGKYQRIITVEELEARPERMISFGSLFGNGRVIVRNQMPTLEYFNHQLTFRRKALPGLFSEMDRMLGVLGGPSSYIAIHARVGDSIFERFAPDVMEKLWSDLQMYIPILKNSKNIEESKDHGRQCYQASSLDGAPISLGPAIDWDQQVILGNRPLVMFIATDTPQPREHNLFKNIYDTFPCIVTLNDLFDFDTSPLATMINPEDGMNYGKFLIPFLDGLMASRAQSFSGSMWSTFSKYIQFLHQVYTTSD